MFLSPNTSFVNFCVINFTYFPHLFMAWYLLPVLCSPVCQSVCISLHLYVCMCVCVSRRATRFKNASVNDSHAHVQIRVKQSAVSVCLSSVSIGNHKTLCLALEYVKICRSGVLFIALGGSGDQILVQKFTKSDCVCITTCTR